MYVPGITEKSLARPNSSKLRYAKPRLYSSSSRRDVLPNSSLVTFLYIMYECMYVCMYVVYMITDVAIPQVIGEVSP